MFCLLLFYVFTILLLYLVDTEMFFSFEERKIEEREHEPVQYLVLSNCHQWRLYTGFNRALYRLYTDLYTVYKDSILLGVYFLQLFYLRPFNPLKVSPLH